MGFFKSSSSNKTYQDFVENTESNVITGAEAPTVAGKNNVVEFTDYESIQRAFDFANSNSVYLGESLATVLGFAEKTSSNALTKVTGAYQTSTGAVNPNSLATFSVIGLLIFAALSKIGKK